MPINESINAAHPRLLLLDGDGSVFLQLASAEDSEQLYRLVHENRQQLAGHLPWARDIDFEEMHQAVQESVNRIGEDGWLQYRIMVPNAAQQHDMVGTVTLHGRDITQHSAHLNCWLAPKAQGHSYARKAIQRLLAYAVPAWRLQCVFLDIEPGNEPAERLAARLKAVPTDQLREEKVGDQATVRRVWELRC